MNDHAPVPWVSDGCNILAGDQGVQVVYVASGSVRVSSEQDEANSRLIVLAPTAPHTCSVPGCPGPENKRRLEAFDEMLAALRRYMSGHPCVGDVQCPTWKEATAAIARAEGK